MGTIATTARSRLRGYSAFHIPPPHSRARTATAASCLARRGGAPQKSFSFSLFLFRYRRRLELWGRSRRPRDRASAGIPRSTYRRRILARGRPRRHRVWPGVVALRKNLFLFRYFFFGIAAGLSYGDDRDDRAIAPPRVFRVPHTAAAFSRADGHGGIVSGPAWWRSAKIFFFFAISFSVSPPA